MTTKPHNATGRYWLCYNGPKRVETLSLHSSLRAAARKLRSLRRKAVEPERYTVNHCMVYSCYPGPVIDAETLAAALTETK